MVVKSATLRASCAGLDCGACRSIAARFLAARDDDQDFAHVPEIVVAQGWAYEVRCYSARRTITL